MTVRLTNQTLPEEMAGWVGQVVDKKQEFMIEWYLVEFGDGTRMWCDASICEDITI